MTSLTEPPPVTSRRRQRAGGVLVALVAMTSLVALVPAPDVSPAQAAGRGDLCGPPIGKDEGGTWSCTFVDQFDAPSIDPRKWLVGETSFSGFTMGPTCFTADNVGVDRGVLRMTAREVRPFQCTRPMFGFRTRYTGAHLATRDRFAQTYGRFEVRARYPESGPGLRGGFWLYPQKPSYGGWPRSGEIDVAEWWSNDPQQVLPSLHYGGSRTEVDSGWDCRVEDPTKYHTYTVVWRPTHMQFLIDGEECFNRSWKPHRMLVAPQPFDKPFNMVLNMAVDWPNLGNGVTATTTLPATYEVDYVKAWK